MEGKTKWSKGARYRDTWRKSIPEGIIAKVFRQDIVFWVLGIMRKSITRAE